MSLIQATAFARSPQAMTWNVLLLIPPSKRLSIARPQSRHTPPGHARLYLAAILNQAGPNVRRRSIVMIRMSRRSMLGGTAATVLMGRGARAQSAEFTYKLAHN